MIAYRLLKDNLKVGLVVSLFSILYLKQIFNVIFKIYLSYELIDRMSHPSYTKPDRAFYGLYGFTASLFMVCIGINLNVLYLYYTKVKQAGDLSDPNDSNPYKVSKMILGWFTLFVLTFAFASGISVIRASEVNDVTANLLGKFYGIAGFTFLILTTAFTVVAGMTIYEIKNKYKHIWHAEGTKMIVATCVLTIPLFTRSIFDLVIGTN